MALSRKQMDSTIHGAHQNLRASDSELRAKNAAGWRTRLRGDRGVPTKFPFMLSTLRSACASGRQTDGHRTVYRLDIHWRPFA